MTLSFEQKLWLGPDLWEVEGFTDRERRFNRAWKALGRVPSEQERDNMLEATFEGELRAM